MEHFDIIIVGGGIAGLYLAYLFDDQFKIKIIEQSANFGGRISTIKGKHNTIEYIYEAGAGRISETHSSTLSLIENLGIDDKLFAITSKKRSILGQNTYSDIIKNKNANKEFYKINKDEKLDTIYLINKVIDSSQKYSRDELINMSFYTLIQLELSSDASLFVYDSFGYISELIDMNAFDAVRMFGKGGDFFHKNQYYILNGGFQQVTDLLLHKLKQKNNIFLQNKTSVVEFLHREKMFTVTTESIFTQTNYTCDRLVFATTRNSLRNISGFNYCPKFMRNLYSVTPHPLCRVYAIFPKNKNGNIWFEGIGKITTDNVIQYIIPIDVKRGLIMISYSDNLYAKFWNKVNMKNRLKKTIMDNLNRLFPDIDIPEPTYLRSHFWKEGCHFYKPGSDSIKISREMIKPFKSKELYICGETYSLNQAWVEGALVTAGKVYDKISKEQVGGKNIELNSLPKISLKEISKHNTKNDAWISIEGMVLDVTDFIDKHPGGSIILEGLGKEFTEKWYKYGHNQNIIKNVFPKYIIGVLDN